MSLKATEFFEGLKQHGLLWALISVLGTISLGVVDQFTSRLVPSIAQAIENRVDPPKFFISFTTPVDISGELSVSSLSADGSTQVKVNKVGDRGVAALAGPGAYELRLRRQRERVTQELVGANTIERANQTWVVDTSERNWANAAALRSGGDNALAPASASTRLTATRWSATAPDFAVLASVQDPSLRSMLANAIAEVGVFENGTDYEKRRISTYWEASGATFPPGTPWGGAFIAWLVRQAGAEPPNGAASFLKWRDWGIDVPPSELGPGMVAVYRLDTAAGLPQSTSRLLVGVVLRRQPDCIETIIGNVADRVVITCVAANLLTGVRRPAPIGGPG